MKKTGLYCFLIIGVVILVQACQSTTPNEEHKTKNLSVEVEPTTGYNIFLDDNQEPIDTNQFRWVLDSSFYKSPQSVLEQLNRYYGYRYKSKTQLLNRDCQKIYGTQDSVWLLTTHTPVKNNIDSACLYPTPTTCFLFNNNGQLLLKKEVLEAQLLPVMKDSLALFMTVEVDCKGVGYHHLYHCHNYKWIDILSHLKPEQKMVSYAANPNAKGKFFKNKMKMKTLDLNEDGYNDFVLEGRWLVLENKKGRRYSAMYPFKIEKKEYIYIYKPAKETFMLESL